MSYCKGARVDMKGYRMICEMVGNKTVRPMAKRIVTVVPARGFGGCKFLLKFCN